MAIDAFGRTLAHTIDFARGSERIRAALSATKPITDALGDIVEIAPELGPEIAAALDHVIGLHGCLDRAMKVLDAKTDIALERVRVELEEQAR